MSAVIDMRTWGVVNDATFDNTPALLSALTRRDAGEPLELFFPAGDWHFTGPLPVGTHSNLSIFDNVTISGVYTAPSVQHQEEGGGNRTRWTKTRTRSATTTWGTSNRARKRQGIAWAATPRNPCHRVTR